MTDTTTGSAAAGTPGAAASGTDGAAAGGAGTTTTTAGAGAQGGGDPWTAGFTNPDLKGFAELRGWTSPEQAVESFRNLEKLQGVPADRLLKLPEAGDVEGLKAVHAKLGFAAPEKATDYGLGAIEGIDPAFASNAEAVMHKHGIPKDMAVAAMTEMLGELGKTEQAHHAAAKAQHETELAALRTEWGPNFDALQEQARRAAAEFMPQTGLADADMDAIRDTIGTAKFNKLWAGIGSKMGEASFVEGAGSGAPMLMTPDAAKVRRDQLAGDQEWFKRYQSGDARAVAEWDLINKTLANAAAATGTVR